MSINSAMLAGSAGLRANASALASISDNISNVNTVGYKRLRNDFTALLNSQSNQAVHNAGGVVASSRSMIGEQGALQSSSVSTHLAISGDGFFVTRDAAADASVVDPFYYTRAGQFSPDSDGYLRNVAGKYLYGWDVNDTGEVTASPTDLTALQPIRVSGIGGAAEASTRVSLSANLQASQEVSDAALALYETQNAIVPRTSVGADYDSVQNSMAMYAQDNSLGVQPDFTSSVQVYDSLGGLRTMTFAFLKSQNANQWHVEVYSDAASIENVNGAARLASTGNAALDFEDGQVAAGLVEFTPFGQLDLTNAGTAGYLDPSALVIGAADPTATTGVRWADATGLAAQSVALDIGGDGSPGGLTQYDTPSALATSQVNGTAFGSLAAVEVDDEGFVTALFTNGLSKKIYQIPIATFSNVDGLIAQSGGSYRSGPNAGPLNMKNAGSAGAGKVNARSLEASTVDLAEEFSNLITTQRAYSASSKIITTADEMLDELIRLKR